MDQSGEYVIPVTYGTVLEVEAAVGERQTFVWDDGLGRASGILITFTVHEDESITGTFMKLSTVEYNGIWSTIFLLILIIVIILIIWVLLRRPVTRITIRYDGRPIKDAVIEYTVGGEMKEDRTDRNGSLRIDAPRGSEVVISSVSIGGAGVTEKLPISFIVEKDRTIELYGKT